ncbi:MAG: hypothetical protein AAF907_08250 [Planctomycetota bacterium]
MTTNCRPFSPASAQAGSDFDHSLMDEALAGLKGRQFVVNNVHDDGPAFLTTRWVLSYLAGPLTRDQIGELMAEKKAALQRIGAAERTAAAEDASAASSPGVAEPVRPVLPSGVRELALPADRLPTGSRCVLRPTLYGTAKLHYTNTTYKLDEWHEVSVCVPVRGRIAGDPWDGDVEDVPADLPEALDRAFDLHSVQFAAAPAELAGSKNFTSWKSKLKDHLYRERRLTVYKCSELKEVSEPGEDERDFRIRLTQSAREHRDREVEKLRKKYATKIRSAERMISTARRRVAREQEQADRAKKDSYLSLGSSLLGALFGRKLMSSTNVRRASTGMRSLGRASDQANDVTEAQEIVFEREENLAAIEDELAAEIEALEDELDPRNLKLTSREIAPRKSDIDVAPIAVLWRPWSVDPTGIAEPAWE